MTDPSAVPVAIQPHGALLALDDDHRVVMASTNTDQLLGVPAEDALGRPLAELIGSEPAAAVAARDAASLSDTPLVVTFKDLPTTAELDGVESDVRVHRSGQRLVVEIESLGRSGPALLSYHSARGAMARLAGAASSQELAEHLAREVCDLTGFDRVMVYRFDEDGTGEVVAEERRRDLEPCLGQKYGASELPERARRLHAVAWTRLIADVGYQPVPMHPRVDPATGAPLDLSRSTLGSVSPGHLARLSSLGITASMSVSLLADDRLWGLVACHHYSGPHRPAQDARAAAEFLGQVASQVLTDRERAEARESALEARAVTAAITARVSASSVEPLAALMDDVDLLRLFGADGAALCHDGAISTRRTTLDEESLRRIAEALEDPEEYATATDRVAELVPGTGAGPEVAGALRIGAARDRWVLLLRRERERGVVSGRSAPWAAWQVEAADALGKHVIGLILMRAREQIAMAESLQRSVVLDRAPEFPGARIAARYQPATTYQLGGDWWDALELADGRLAFAVGDAAGHGVSAASAMTQLRTALRAYLFEGHPPAECLDRLDLLMDGLLDQRVATAAVAVVDPRTGIAQLSSAGHPPPLLVRGGLATQVPVEARPLLGIGTGTATTTEVDLRGGTLLIYTDGLVEQRGVDIVERTERLRALAGATHDPGDLDGWLEGLLVIQDTTPADDTTMLAVRLDDPVTGRHG